METTTINRAYIEKTSIRITGFRKVISFLFGITCALLPFLCLVDINILNLPFDKVVFIAFGLLFLLLFVFLRVGFKADKTFFLFVFFLTFLTTNSIVNDSCGVFGIGCSWIIGIFVFCFGCTNFFSPTTFKRTVVVISLAAVLIVAVQYFSYYVFGKYISFVPISLYRKDIVSEYGSFLITGFDNGYGMLRPTAFFVEPAHMAEYCLLGLVISLFFDKRGMAKSIVISLGIILTTSGIGIALATFFWVLKILRIKGTKKIAFILAFIVIGLTSAVVLNNVGILSTVFSRFSFSKSGSGFSSRFNDVGLLFNDISFSQLLFGEGFDSPSTYWVSGIFSLIRQLGFIGLFLFLFVSISFISKRSKNIYFVLLYILLLVFAEVSSLTYFVFYLCLGFNLRLDYNLLSYE